MIRDTATVANGSFSFSGTLNHPTDAYLYAGELNARDNNRIRRFMLDLADMTVSLSGDDYSKAPVSGSPSTVESDSLDAVIAGIYSMADPYKDIIRNHETTTPALIDSLQRFVLTPMRDSVFHTRLNFVKTHPASFNNLGVMYVLAQDLTYPQIKEIYESWNPEVQAAATLVKHQLNRLAAIQPGNPLPSFKAPHLPARQSPSAHSRVNPSSSTSGQPGASPAASHFHTSKRFTTSIMTADLKSSASPPTTRTWKAGVKPSSRTV